MRGERGTDPPQGLGIGGLGSAEVEPARGTAGRVEQEGLALSAPSGDHPERRAGLVILDEPRQRRPFVVAVEHLDGLVHASPTHASPTRRI
jgi:hypothetical protein